MFGTVLWLNSHVHACTCVIDLHYVKNYKLQDPILFILFTVIYCLATALSALLIEKKNIIFVINFKIIVGFRGVDTEPVGQDSRDGGGWWTRGSTAAHHGLTQAALHHDHGRSAELENEHESRKWLNA